MLMVISAPASTKNEVGLLKELSVLTARLDLERSDYWTAHRFDRDHAVRGRVVWSVRHT
jgi:hypothetical protein